jgi:1-deoxy-D-xylulose-5-phosphate synthase
MTKWIHKINSPQDLKKVPVENLPEVAQEYREFLIECISKTGGHLGSSLGSLEINIALHYVLDSPKDKICWDVGHQAYGHKMITGRRDQMKSIRQPDGISGFPSPFENRHDHFIVGHAGTAISQALGLATARDLNNTQEEVVAVVGDGALTSGLAYEALNNAGHMKKKMLIVLNDNEMSIAKNVGALSNCLNQVITNPIYNRIRDVVEKQLDKFPRLRKFATKNLEGVKNILVPGMIFEELGFRYFGPVDGHDIVGLVETFQKILVLKDCSLIHVVTEKGKGYSFAEKDKEKLHGVTPFCVTTGEKVKSDEGAVGVSYTKAFADALTKLAGKDPRVIAITAAMPTGTGLVEFQQKYPDRFFDVGIAEQHAITFAGALAKGGYRPYCAIYSTFLQRSQDNLIHDVALQRLPTVVCLDRAGLVGADGATHNGVFDISYLGHIPNVVIAAPKDEFEMQQMLELGLDYKHLFAVRYPRGNVPLEYEKYPKNNFKIGEAEVLSEGEDGTILALGSMVLLAVQTATLLKEREGLSLRVVNMRFARPLDEKIILESLEINSHLYTMEEHVLAGGFGSKVLEFLERASKSQTKIKRFALPDQFVEHGSKDVHFSEFGLSPEKMSISIAEHIRSQNADVLS